MALPLLNDDRMRLVLALVMSLAHAGWPALPADAEPVPTPLIKAVYLFNFARFTEWPATGTQGPLTLCVLGDADVASSLDGLIGDRPINGRNVSVASLATFRIVRTCHLLYVAGDDSTRTAGALDAVTSLHVFTVGDGEPFVRAGGIAALVIEDGKTKFAINPDALNRSGLRVSSKMLGLARLIREESR